MPREKSGEYFSDHYICGTGASFAGSLQDSFTGQQTGSANIGVGALSLMFLIGFFVFGKADKTPKSV